MSARTRRIAETAVILLIIAVAALLLTRVLTYHQAMTTAPRFGTPRIEQDLVTIPDRPHDVLDFMENPESVVRRTSYHWSSDANGFRGRRDASPDKPPGVFRIAVVGECVAFGQGVEDQQAWPAQLEQLARERWPAMQIEVINASTPASPDFVFGRLEQLVPGYDPDVVMLSPGADLLHHEHLDAQGRFALELPEARYQQLLGTYRDRYQRAADLMEQHGVEAVFVTPTMNSFFLPAMLRWVEATKRSAAERGIPVLDTTALVRSQERERGLVFERDGNTQRLRAFDGGQERILVEIESSSDRYIDPTLYRWLDEHPDVGLAVGIDENHPNPEGHRLIAEAALELLESQGLLPR